MAAKGLANMDGRNAEKKLFWRMEQLLGRRQL